MKVEELVELLENCYSDAEIVIDNGSDVAAGIEALEIDDAANIVYIKMEG